MDRLLINENQGTAAMEGFSLIGDEATFRILGTSPARMVITPGKIFTVAPHVYAAVVNGVVTGPEILSFITLHAPGVSELLFINVGSDYIQHVPLEPN